ncbi:FAD-binding domain-containing protein [Xylariaceae sp. FL0804]|nr:FAD-binding domain-containing protein [Xylariaceae sp. FL0804]
MANLSFFSALMSKLSPGSKILRNPEDPEFKTSMARWSNLDVKTPLAIAVSADVPFVPASGGHSSWSSIRDGIVIDLRLYSGVEVNPGERLATVKGGTLMTGLQSALHPHRQFAAVGNGSTVGVIPYYLGGGINTPFIGYGCENIVSAKLVNAQGELIDVSEQSPELLWGIRGAGQFLGLITEITIKTYPYSMLGNEEGQRMCGTYVFLPSQLDAVCAALQKIMESREYVSAGHFMIAQAPPDLKQQVLFVAPQVFCSESEATALFQPLVDIGPVQQMLVPSTFKHHRDRESDHLDWICAKGDFKRFTQNGMAGWSTENFRRLVNLHAELVKCCPDAARSGYSVEWHTPCKAEREDTSFGHQDVDYWLNLLSWYTDPSNHGFVSSMDQKGQDAMRAGTAEDAFVSYTNTTREGPLEYRYKGAETIDKLKSLKNEFDPSGVFTNELL